MTSKSLFKNCKKCDRAMSVSLNKCPHCGALNSKLSIIHWLGIGIFLYVIIIAFNQENDPPASIIQSPSEESIKKQIQKKMELDFTWRKEGFDNIMNVDLIVKNNSLHDIKDIEIVCNHYSKSGTQIDTNVQKIFEIIRASSSQSFLNFNMGFIHKQAHKSSCHIKDFALF